VNGRVGDDPNDIDGDRVPNQLDTCPGVPNPYGMDEFGEPNQNDDLYGYGIGEPCGADLVPYLPLEWQHLDAYTQANQLGRFRAGQLDEIQLCVHENRVGISGGDYFFTWIPGLPGPCYVDFHERDIQMSYPVEFELAQITLPSDVANRDSWWLYSWHLDWFSIDIWLAEIEEFVTVHYKDLPEQSDNRHETEFLNPFFGRPDWSPQRQSNLQYVIGIYNPDARFRVLMLLP